MDSGQGDTTKRYPYDFLEDEKRSGYYDEALDELNASRKDGLPHIPTFAQRMLERLKKVGLLHRTDTEPPSNVRKVTLDKKQDLWIRFDTRRDYDEGYTAVEVVDPPRSDTAILAAMTAWLAQPIDFKQIIEATRYVLSGTHMTEIEKIGKIAASLRRTRTSRDLIVASIHVHMLRIRLDLSRFLNMMGRTEEIKNISGILSPKTEWYQDIALKNVESTREIETGNVD